MLRQPGSPYEAGRSSTLLKVTTCSDKQHLATGARLPHVGRFTEEPAAQLSLPPNSGRSANNSRGHLVRPVLQFPHE
jgi:hypothetical protein